MREQRYAITIEGVDGTIYTCQTYEQSVALKFLTQHDQEGASMRLYVDELTNGYDSWWLKETNREKIYKLLEQTL